MVSPYTIYTIPLVTFTCKTVIHFLRKHARIIWSFRNLSSFNNFGKMPILLQLKASTKYVTSQRPEYYSKSFEIKLRNKSCNNLNWDKEQLQPRGRVHAFTIPN